MTMATDRDTRREAYQHGYNDGMELTTAEIMESEDRLDDPEEVVHRDFHHVTESARWANHIAPRLRRLAGYQDPAGMGTFTDPAGTDSWELDEVVEAYRDGRIDRTLGYDRFKSRPDLRPEEEP